MNFVSIIKMWSSFTEKMAEKCPLCKMDVVSVKIHWRINHKKVEFSPGKVNVGFKAGKISKKIKCTRCSICREKVKNIDQHNLIVHPVRLEPDTIHLGGFDTGKDHSSALDNYSSFITVVNSIVERKRRKGLKRWIEKKYPCIPWNSLDDENFKPFIKYEQIKDVCGEMDRLDTDR